MFFETERLYVRKFSLTDILAFDEMHGNFNVMKYTTGRTATKEENLKELKRLINTYKNLSNDYWVMAVIRKSDNQFVGTCAIIKNEDGEHEIGYRVLEKYWGNGFGKEIAASLIEYSLVSMDLDLITAYVYKENKASVRILDNSQMKLVSEFKNEEVGYLERYYRLEKREYEKM